MHEVCLDDLRRWRGQATTVWGPDQVKVKKSAKCGATKWRDLLPLCHVLQQSAYNVSGQFKAVAHPGRDSVVTGSGQS
jgi:hypothetical protein